MSNARSQSDSDTASRVADARAMTTCSASLLKLDRIDEHVRHWGKTRGADVAFHFLSGGKPTDQLTFGALDAGARGIAYNLVKQMRMGEPVLLAYAPGLEFIRAYFGCLYAGLVPVPLELPRNARGAEKLKLVAAVAEARFMLSDSRSLAQLALRLGGITELSLNCIATDLFHGDSGIGDDQLPQLSSDALALLQFTSGSTGTPKGVMVTHRQLLANERTIAQAFAHDDDTIVAGWLPFFHDMGLIGNVLQPAYLGRPCILMAPQDFIQSPVRWLQAISDYRATTGGAPNFGYALCTSKVKESALDSLDLSSWRLAFNGAEPVRADVMRAFSVRFRRCGFQEEAFYPCYGLAEGTLFVSGAHWNARNRTDAAATESAAVSNGPPGKNCEIRIVDSELCTEKASGEVGEIWIAGASIASGYWQNALASTVFHAECADMPGKQWLRTGDLGFMRDGCLYPTGRLRDLIIIRGTNYFPDDIEATVQHCWDALNVSSVAAFSVEGAKEPELIVAIEHSRGRISSQDAAKLLTSIRAGIATDHGLTIKAVVFLPVGSLPRTSSGKLRRGACRERFTSGAWAERDLDCLRLMSDLEDACPA